MKSPLIALALAAATTLAQADPSGDLAMLQLAQRSGCIGCHQVEPGASRRDGLAPIGPAFRDVAAKYRGNKGAAARLAQVVYAGSNPYDSHWKDKVAGLAMPPNAVVVSEADARKLVKWILALDAAGKG